jgi:hypothetical protein
MHVDDLGIWVYMTKKYLVSYLEAKLGSPKDAKKALQRLSVRMAQMPRASDFSLPKCKGKYFPDHSAVQACEHRRVMQILPFLANGLFDKDDTDSGDGYHHDDLMELATL